MTEPILSVQGLTVEFETRAGSVRVVENATFDLKRGRTLGIVGESGSGKSVTSLAIMGLLASNARVRSGSAVFEGRDLLQMSERELQNVRGADVAMIFQDPMTSLNPSYTIGFQIREALRLHGRGPDGERLRSSGRHALDAAAVELLDQVGIQEPRERLASYPHQLSGGMSQRAMIAMAIACRPKLLIADEPTTALDVTVQAQILELLRKLRRERDMSMILITHDIGVVAQMADEIMVMRKGRGLELGPARDVIARPRHPYTRALLECLPARHAMKAFRTRLPTVGLIHEEQA